MRHVLAGQGCQLVAGVAKFAWCSKSVAAAWYPQLCGLTYFRFAIMPRNILRAVVEFVCCSISKFNGLVHLVLDIQLFFYLMPTAICRLLPWRCRGCGATYSELDARFGPLHSFLNHVGFGWKSIAQCHNWSWHSIFKTTFAGCQCYASWNLTSRLLVKPTDAALLHPRVWRPIL